MATTESNAVTLHQPRNVVEMPHQGRPVLAAIANVMRAVGSVEKRGENKFHGYVYATAADIAQALQKLMAENGLVIVQRERDTRYDSDMGMLAIRYDFDVQHASGDHLEPVQHTGMSAAKNSKGGFDDKAANKCHTAARKYFLLGLFQIPTGDYPDADSQEDQPAPKPTRAEKYRETKKPEAAPPVDQPPAPSFELVNGDGELITYDKLGDYLTGLKLAVSAAPDKGALWSDNAKAFEEILGRAKSKNAAKAISALESAREEINQSLAK